MLNKREIRRRQVRSIYTNLVENEIVKNVFRILVLYVKKQLSRFYLMVTK